MRVKGKKTETSNRGNLQKKGKRLEIKPHTQITQRSKTSQGKSDTKEHAHTWRVRVHGAAGKNVQCSVFALEKLFQDGSARAVSPWLSGDLSSLPTDLFTGCLHVLMTSLRASPKVGHSHCSSGDLAKHKIKFQSGRQVAASLIPTLTAHTPKFVPLQNSTVSPQMLSMRMHHTLHSVAGLELTRMGNIIQAKHNCKSTIPTAKYTQDRNVYMCSRRQGPECSLQPLWKLFKCS